MMPEPTTLPPWQSRLRAWAGQLRLPPDRPEAICPLAAPDRLAVTLARVLTGLPEGALVLTAEHTTAETLQATLQVYLDLLGDTRQTCLLPPAGNPDRRYWIPQNEAARSAALDVALREPKTIFIAAANAVLSRIQPPQRYRAETLDLAVGETRWPPEKLAAFLTGLDYDNELEVHVPGEFARRGGILDLFSPLYPNPVRLEYDGSRLESLRFFRAETQLSITPTERIRITPRGDLAGAVADGAAATFLEYLAPESPLVICSPEDIADHLERFSGAAFAAAWRELSRGARRRILLVPQDPAAAAEAEQETVSLGEVFGAALGELGAGTELWRWQQIRSTLRRWQGQGYTLVAFCGTAEECGRFREILDEVPETRNLPVVLQPASLNAGLMIHPAALVLLSEHDLFGRRTQPRDTRANPYHTETARQEGTDLETGCYAVHAVHGICLYHGIHEIETHGHLQEALDLEFAENRRLYVPLDQVFLVSRYLGGSKKLPKLSRLGGVSWKNAREAAAASALDLAAELLRIAAVREQAAGVAYGEEGAWERPFAAAFPFAETQDQTRAIAETLGDMAKPRPMDRLICGDAGYGKTEVAMRAAFRAVMNGKQVALLVPTTVLAQQHYLTFRERMAEFPVRIEMLSRFRSRGEQQRTLEAARAGAVDVLIGTHRLLQRDVKFHDLGLVIIDEEQRFGVEHKEKFKHLRTSVDVLTMTATPIPRTLYFSLSGIRGLSTIATPPVDRLPITTVVCQWDNDLIREAMLRELERKGQIFFLHNRVQSIQAMTAKLQQLVPEARIAIGHGQMPPEELEATMNRFVLGEVDVLVCTTIIESGLDISNANTIFIDHAERFGLADLYQLRGRVGRYHHQAYAYLLLPALGTLPANARQRLGAIRRYTHLGAGFKLALRDLEIRGAGNFLGPEQSGHIAAVGFELYSQLLREAVNRLEHRPLPVVQDLPLKLEMVSFSLQDQRPDCVSAAIPPSYIGGDMQRLECYRQIRALATLAELDTFAAGLTDRFGPPPPEVRCLVEVTRIRLLARLAGLVSVTVKERRLYLETSRGLWRTAERKLPQLSAHTPAARLGELRKWLENYLKKTGDRQPPGTGVSEKRGL